MKPSTPQPPSQPTYSPLKHPLMQPLTLPTRIAAEFPNTQLNATPIEELFAKYEEIGFLYPAKKKLLLPHIGRITRNWKNALRAGNKLLWVLTHQGPKHKDFASIAVWKQSNYGVLAQHLVSSGNPYLSLKVMLAAQYRAEKHCSADSVRSSQNWFRPDNRYAFRIFASMYSKLGNKQAALSIFQYLQQPLSRIKSTPRTDLTVEEVTGIDPAFIAFVKSEYGGVFVKAEELDQEDIQLQKIGATYADYNLHRSRKILKVIDNGTGRIIGALVANRGPLGANFSFLENRAYLITDFSLSEERRSTVCGALLSAIKPYYQNLALGAIPIVTNEANSETLQQHGGRFIREYVQSIWLREGFSAWYDHINTFLERISRRKDVN